MWEGKNVTQTSDFINLDLQPLLDWLRCAQEQIWKSERWEMGKRKWEERRESGEIERTAAFRPRGAVQLSVFTGFWLAFHTCLRFWGVSPGLCYPQIHKGREKGTPRLVKSQRNSQQVTVTEDFIRAAFLGGRNQETLCLCRSCFIPL